MKNFRKNVQKSRNGITLIALVITIIVLLILAGISISMLAGDNGILQRATDAKTNTERKSVIESAQTDILGQIAENKGETITETQLKTILGKYFEAINEDLPEDLSETTIALTAKEEYGGYTNIALADIYNGKILKTVVTNLYHLSVESHMGDGYAIISLIDEDNNIIPITLDNNPRGFGESSMTFIDGGKIKIRDTSGRGTGFQFSLDVNGETLSEFVMIFPALT